MIRLIFLALIAMNGSPPQWQDPGEIRQVAFHPNDDTIAYVLASQAGPFQTNEGGDSWVYLRQGLPQSSVEEYITFKTHPDRPCKIYIIESNSIWKRSVTDQNWALWSELPQGNAFHTLTFCADKSENMLAGTEGDHCLIKSTNGGKTWLPLTGPFPENALIHKIATCPDHPEIIYTVVYRSFPDLNRKSYYRIFKTNDGGNSFKAIGRKFDRIDAIAVIPGKKNTLLISADTDIGSDDSNGLFISTNGGKTWRRRQPGWYTSIVVSQSDTNFIIATGEKLVQSSNTGQSFVEMKKPMDEFFYHVAVSSHNSDLIYIASEKRLYRSKNKGKEWKKVLDLSGS